MVKISSKHHKSKTKREKDDKMCITIRVNVVVVVEDNPINSDDDGWTLTIQFNHKV